MSWTSDEETRVQQSEKALAKILIAIKNLASKRMVNQLLAVLQEENRQLRADIVELQAQVELLKANR